MIGVVIFLLILIIFAAAGSFYYFIYTMNQYEVVRRLNKHLRGYDGPDNFNINFTNNKMIVSDSGNEISLDIESIDNNQVTARNDFISIKYFIKDNELWGSHNGKTPSKF